jgi:hypothetical protein
MTDRDYRPKYKWRETWPGETGLDGEPLQDFQGWDGDVSVGRIRLEDAGPMKGKWQWSGHGSQKGIRKRLLPHQGYVATAREASRMVEDYYERLLRHNGMKGSQDVD